MHRVNTYYPFLVSVGLVLLLNSCKKDKLKEEKEILIGRWNWVYTDHSYGWCDNMQHEEMLTPSTENKVFSLEFLKKGCLKFIQGENDVVNEYRIVFHYFTVLSSTSASFNIYLDNDENMTLGGVINGTSMLVLSFPFTPIPGCENYQNYFIKE